MAWSSSGSISLTTDWQYTEPIPAGSFFRLTHTEAPNGGLFVIAQAEIDAEGNVSLINSQVMASEKRISDIIPLPKPGCFTERRIALKKIPKQPTLEQEVKRLFLPGYLQPTQEQVRIAQRSNWSIEIEVSDFIEPTPTVDFAPIHTKLDAIIASIEALETSGTPVPTLTDPHFANVALLLPMNGANGGTVFTDVKGKLVTVGGNAQISTALGESSAYFDGSGDYLSIPDSPDFNFGASDFTIEGFVHFPTVTGGGTIIGKNNFVNGGFGPWFVYRNGTQLQFYGSSAGSSWDIGSGISFGNVVANTWHHFALSRAGSNIRLFLDGILGNTINFNGSVNSNSQNVVVGAGYSSLGYGDFALAYLKSLRITKNIARYTATFTPPTLPFPQSSTPATNSKVLTYVSNGDTNGLFYYLGTDNNTVPFTNPATSGKIIITATNPHMDSDPKNLVGRDNLNYSSGGNFGIGQYVRIDLGENRKLALKTYTILGRGDEDGYHLRNWDFQGSNDALSWITLDGQMNNTAITQNTYFSKTLPGESIEYRYFQIKTTGADSTGQNALTGNEIELYGVLINI